MSRFASIVLALAKAAAEISPRAKTALSYLAAVVIMWWVARGIPLAAITSQVANASLGLFMATAIIAFVAWLLGETLLFSRLFTYFHHRTSFREMLAPTAAQYFLQLVNAAVANSALIVFLNRRKGVAWLAVGFTLLFQALIDFQVMLLMALTAFAITPRFPLPHAGYYLMAALGALWLIAWFWMRGRPRSRLGQRLYDLPAMSSFRQARLSHFVRLSLIRAVIFAMQGFALYFEMRAFHIDAPLRVALALTPVILLVTSIPLTPVGLGSEQAAMVLCFHAFGSTADLVAASLAVSASNIVFRIGLGMIFLRPFVTKSATARMTGADSDAYSDSHAYADGDDIRFARRPAVRPT